jgi:hypothetical protein
MVNYSMCKKSLYGTSTISNHYDRWLVLFSSGNFETLNFKSQGAIQWMLGKSCTNLRQLVEKIPCANHIIVFRFFSDS